MIEKLREFGREHILSHLNLLNNSEVVVVSRARDMTELVST